MSLAIEVSLVDDPMEEEFPLLQRKVEFQEISRPTEDQLEAFDTTGTTFSAFVVDEDQKQTAITVTLITVTLNAVDYPALRLSMANSVFRQFLGKPCRYFVAATKDGKTGRIWTDSFKVKKKGQS